MDVVLALIAVVALLTAIGIAFGVIRERSWEDLWKSGLMRSRKTKTDRIPYDSLDTFDSEDYK